MTVPIDGSVHKVIRLVATSERSWEDAARSGVAEAAKTIVNLESAKVTEMDSVIIEGNVQRYRIKLEMTFQLDRARRLPGSDEVVHVRRSLIVANQTLVSQALHQLVDNRVSEGPSEFHVLVPQAQRSMISRRRHQDREEAEAAERLRGFLYAFEHRLGRSLTGEVGLGDPVAAVRAVMERSSFDDIIVSTLPLTRSHWLRRDLPARLEQAFSIPVTTLFHDEGSDLTSCPIG